MNLSNQIIELNESILESVCSFHGHAPYFADIKSQTGKR